MSKQTSLVSWGDFIDVYYKVKFKGAKFLLSKVFHTSFKDRVSSKWDSYASVSDFWIIPEIKKRWNQKISGNESTIYEDYTWSKYLSGKSGLKLLSIGCGDGGHERNFAKYSNFESLCGVDVSPESINKAKRLAVAGNLRIDYFCDDFFRIDFSGQMFDVILFNASLHHFSNINIFLKNNIEPLLSDDGIVVAFEYCGPNRLQWRNSQLHEANRLLRDIPKKFKTLVDEKTVKRKVYRPGLIRMLLNDPSEAPDSANLAPALRNNFEVLEETKLGWNILHILLKDIAHNFLSDQKNPENREAKEIIDSLMAAEEQFIKTTGENDAIFGVYRKKQ